MILVPPASRAEPVVIIDNEEGMTLEEAKKVLRPYAENSGPPVDLRAAGDAAVAFLKENPSLLPEVAKLLRTAS